MPSTVIIIGLLACVALIWLAVYKVAREVSPPPYLSRRRVSPHVRGTSKRGSTRSSAHSCAYTTAIDAGGGDYGHNSCSAPSSCCGSSGCGGGSCD